jgi:hypothetical protein
LIHLGAGSWLLWGSLATLLLTILLAGAQALGLTRTSLPFLLGTVLSARRGTAKVVGFFVHLALGLVFALLYAAVFESIGAAGPVRGAILGLGHAAFVLLVVMPILPAFHPRMASEQCGPSVTRQLEPPGMAGLHYGVRTPISIVLAHVAYGALFGAFYRPG